VLATQAYPFRVMLWVIGFLGGLALVLTATGIYGVMSYLVSQRTKEIGIRVALGADRWNVVKMVMRQSMKQAAVGAALGVAAALAVAPVFAHELAAVDPFEPAAYCSAVALVWLAAVAACYWPARRAAALDPLTALRCD
jgi:ABC-type antimicrobial peptide transport system permease subunit